MEEGRRRVRKKAWDSSGKSAKRKFRKQIEENGILKQVCKDMYRNGMCSSKLLKICGKQL